MYIPTILFIIIIYIYQPPQIQRQPVSDREGEHEQEEPQSSSTGNPLLDAIKGMSVNKLRSKDDIFLEHEH